MRLLSIFTLYRPSYTLLLYPKPFPGELIVGEKLDSVQVLIFALLPFSPVSVEPVFLHSKTLEEVVTDPTLRISVNTFVFINIAPTTTLQSVLLLHLIRPDCRSLNSSRFPSTNINLFAEGRARKGERFELLVSVVALWITIHLPSSHRYPPPPGLAGSFLIIFILNFVILEAGGKGGRRDNLEWCNEWKFTSS